MYISKDASLYKVSILVPIYGVEKFIARCAASLFEQTYENLEYIFVDDCSPDKSVEILKNEIGNYPNRVHQIRILRHTKNKGLGAARNTAVNAATGDFIYHVDSDDFIDKECIRLCVAEQIKTDADVISVYYLTNGLKRNVVKKSLNTQNPRLLNQSVITHSIPNNVWGRLIRKSLYIDNDIRVQDGVNMSEDLNVLPRLLYYAKKISCVPSVLHYYECSNMNSYTSNYSRNNFNQEQKTYDLLKSFFSEKDSELEECVQERECAFYIKTLFDCVKKDDKSMYCTLREHISKFPLCKKNRLNIFYNIALIIRPYVLFRFFVRIASFSKNLIIDRL